MRCLRTLLVVVSCFLTQCTSDKTAPSEAVKNAPAPKNAAPRVAVLPPEQCQTFANDDMTIPLFIPSQQGGGIMVTRVTKPCITRDGLRGFEKGTEWMALGLPCTGGRGAIDITGKIYNPKMLGFILSTDCNIAPASIDVVKDLGKTIGLTQEAKLLAYNPLSVQFWEVDGFLDTDVGFRVELRSDDMIRNFWNDFKAHTKKLHVRIYGRENAWVQDDTMFMAEGDFVFENPNHFRFDLQKAKAMSPQDIEQVKQRCEAIKPRRNCGDVF